MTIDPAALDAFVACVERTHAEHTVSFIQAGDDRVYAYGAEGYSVVFTQHVFDALVEVLTPHGSLRIERGGEGRLAIESVGEAPSQPTETLLDETCKALERYYARRYWRV